MGSRFLPPTLIPAAVRPTTPLERPALKLFAGRKSPRISAPPEASDLFPRNVGCLERIIREGFLVRQPLGCAVLTSPVRMTRGWNRGPPGPEARPPRRGRVWNLDPECGFRPARSPLPGVVDAACGPSSGARMIASVEGLGRHRRRAAVTPAPCGHFLRLSVEVLKGSHRGRLTQAAHNSHTRVGGG